MGEYGLRNDGCEVKIGTCENMYYLRYSDRHMIRPLEGNLDPNDDSILKELRWRLPFPDEDHIKPGEYPDYNRDAALCGEFTSPDNANDPGILQLHSKTGLLVNITCYHGEKLPENTKDVKFFWNGKKPAYVLKHLKFIDGETFGVYSCTECRREWRRPLKDLIPFMIRYEDQELVKRLIEWYCPDMFKKVPVI